MISTLERICVFSCNTLGFDTGGQLKAQNIPTAEALVCTENHEPFPLKVSFIWKFFIPFPGMALGLTAQLESNVIIQSSPHTHSLPRSGFSALDLSQIVSFPLCTLFKNISFTRYSFRPPQMSLLLFHGQLLHLPELMGSY